MATAQLATVIQRIRRLAGDQSDGDLLRAFLSANDPSAFEALMRRHGPMVLRVCQRALGNTHDAEDAFQATFLVLARQAHSIRKSESLASWLHGVGYRMATHARRAAARRHKHEMRVRPNQGCDVALSAAWQEIQTLLDEEIRGLPEILRVPFISCCLENKSCAETARELGVKEGTVGMRLSRARKVLQERLTRRGVSPAAVFAAVAVGGNSASAAVAAGVMASTLTAGLQVARGGALVDMVSPRIAALTERMLRTMSISKLKLATAALVFALGIGLAVSGWATAQPTPPSPPPPPAKAGQTLTTKDVLTSYKQNYARFETLRVSWALSHEKTPAWFKAQEAHVAHLEKVVTRPDLKPDVKDQLTRQLEIARYGLGDPSNKGKQFLVQDFWTDRQRFQVRTPWREFQPVTQPEDERFGFPDESPDKPALETTYKDICVLSFPGDMKKGFRVWEGRQKRGSHVAVIFIDFPNPNLFPFPPLGGDDKRWGGKWHAMETFFALPADQLTMTGAEMVDGRKTHVVTHTRVNKDANAFLANGKEYQGKLHRIELTRAWVDVPKGCLPVKIEWESYFVFNEDGKCYSTRSGPYQRLEVKSIEQVKNGGYYPAKGLLTRYGIVRKDDDPSFDDFLRGKGPKRPWVALEEDGWEAYLVQAGRKMEPSLFALELPKNTLYDDLLTKKSGSTSDD